MVDNIPSTDSGHRFEALPGPAGDVDFDPSTSSGQCWGGWSTPVLVADDMALMNTGTQASVWSGGDGP